MVYLIHFETPFKHAQHYLGYSKDELFDKRIAHHKAGSGSRLMRAVSKAGIEWTVVRMWPGEDGKFERKLKGGHRKHLCPICNPEKFVNNGKEKMQ